MKIDSYEFGKMVIDGLEYTKDLIICEDTVIPDWRREAGHVLTCDDFQPLLDYIQPSLIIVGTGKHGMMIVPDSVIETIKKLKVQVYWDKTDDAVKYYNDEYEGMIVVGCFHLTC